MNPVASEDKTHDAVLVVHGIGAQAKLGPLTGLMNGLQRVDPIEAAKEVSDGMFRKVGGKPVRFYEVYWADLLKGEERTRGAFQMSEFQSVTWFPWRNIRAGNYRRGDYSILALAWWCGFLPVVNFLALFAYYGASFVASLFQKSDKESSDRRSAEEPEHLLRTITLKAAGKSRKYTKCDEVLDEYFGDVFSYVNSAGGAFYRTAEEPPVPEKVKEAFPDIMERFREKLRQSAESEGCETIHVVAHSLGTVIAYHALAGYRFDADSTNAQSTRSAFAKIGRLYTIGSPLEKIRFFWPKLGQKAADSGVQSVQWDNFVSFFDPVAGTIKRYKGWGRVSNHALLGGGFIRGHVVYERNAKFLNVLTKGLCGREIPLKRTFWARLADWFLLVCETLFAPALATAVLLLGLAFVLLGALMVPYLISLGLRQFLPQDLWVAIQNWLSLFFLGGMFLAFLVAPIVRAKRVHSMFWEIRKGGS